MPTGAGVVYGVAHAAYMLSDGALDELGDMRERAPKAIDSAEAL